MGTSRFSQLGLGLLVFALSFYLPPHYHPTPGLQPVASTLQRVTHLTELGFECCPSPLCVSTYYTVYKYSMKHKIRSLVTL